MIFLDRVIQKLTDAFPQENGDLPVTGLEGGSVDRMTRREAQKHIEILNETHFEVPFCPGKGRPTAAQRRMRTQRAKLERNKKNK